MEQDGQGEAVLEMSDLTGFGKAGKEPSLEKCHLRQLRRLYQKALPGLGNGSVRVFWRHWFALPLHRCWRQDWSRLNLFRYCGQSLYLVVNDLPSSHVGINQTRLWDIFPNLIFLPTHRAVYNWRLLDPG